jgi:glycosidase
VCNVVTAFRHRRLPASYKTHNVESERSDPDSVLQFYRHLLKLRHTDQALLDGKYVPLNPQDA